PEGPAAGGNWRQADGESHRHGRRESRAWNRFSPARAAGVLRYSVDHLYAAPVFVSHYRKKQLRYLVVVAPDVGSAKMARGFAKRLNGTFAIIDKRRPTANVAEVLNVVGEVEGRDC